MVDEVNGGVSFTMPDMSKYQKEADEAKQKEAAKASKGAGSSAAWDVWWYEWKEGDNNLMFFPPYNKAGDMFKKVYKMHELPTSDKGETHQCIELTHPSLNIKCPIYTELKLAKANGLTVDDYMPDEKIYGWVRDLDGGLVTWDDTEWDATKKEAVPVKLTDNSGEWPQCIRLTPKIYEQLVQMMFNPDTMMYFDPNQGIPITIKKTTPPKGTKGFVKYELTTMKTRVNGQTVCLREPLHTDPEKLKLLLERHTDMDVVFSPPLELLKEGGKIAMCAIKLKTYFANLLSNPAQLTTHSTTPGIVPITNQHVEATKTETPAPTAQPVVVVEETTATPVVTQPVATSETVAETKKEEIVTTETTNPVAQTEAPKEEVKSDVVSTEGKPDLPAAKFPNSPPCYYHYMKEGIEKKDAKGNPLTCEKCMFAPLCKTDTAKHNA